MARDYVPTAWITVAIIALVAAHCTAQQTSQEKSIDRTFRQVFFPRSRPTPKPKIGFFGTIFHLVLEQINDTKSAYNQISELVSNQFVDDNAPSTEPPSVNDTTPAPKISRAEFLKILDRNLKGLARLRRLEWREANKDTRANLRGYKDEIFLKKEHRDQKS